ncbi:DUF6049 family protein [Protaetiibacter intestinalis]|uniref:DUF6049 family protein n=1 Tax=Protaetiibacter intestinalis TaxID=2419774 RepID=UPI001300AB39|nr:DUF6049 family protein [Protaetiibacter intestinalis]
MPLTTRRAWRALASGLLAAAVLAVVASPVAADPEPEQTPTTRTASVATVTPGVGPLSIAVIMPIVVPPEPTGLIPAEDLARYTASFGLLTRQLDAVQGSTVTLAVDPMVFASIRVLGSSAPESAIAWLARLEALDAEVFTLAYADADVAAAARTDTLDVLQPSGFGFALDPADFTPVETASPSPTPSPEPTAPVDPDAAPPFPSTEDVLAWSSTLPTIAWPGASGIGPDQLAPLAAAGYEDVLVSDESVGAPSTPLVTLDGIQGIVTDTGLSSLLGDAAGAVTEAELTSALEALRAELAADATETPGRGIVLTLGRVWPYTMSSLPEALTAINAAASSQLVPLSEILATTPSSATLAEAADETERDAAFTDAASDAAAELQFSSVLADPTVLLDPRRLERIALYGLGWSSDASGWTDAVTAFHERSQEITNSIRLERGSDVLQLARNTEFRVSVSNALEFPVTVRVSIDPKSPILQVAEPVDLTVEPGATGTAYLKVEAVANGEVLVQTDVHSPTGVPLDTGFVRVTVQAEWEGIGTLVVILLLVAVFGAGIVRLVLRRRKERRAAAEAPLEDADV